MSATPQISGIVSFSPGQPVPAGPFNANFAAIQNAFNSHTHTASDIAAGTFNNGVYTFPGNIQFSTGLTIVSGGADVAGGIRTDSLNATGTITGNLFAGSGANLTNVPAGSLTGTIDVARMPADTMYLNGAQSVTGAKTFTGILAATASIQSERASAAQYAFTASVTGDTGPRLAIAADGTIEMGSGSGATDAFIRRAGAGVVEFPGSINVRAIPYTWPAANGAGAFINNGTGTLSWSNAPTLGGLTLNSGQGVISERNLNDISGATTVDFSLRNNVRARLTATTTITPDGGVDGGFYTLYIEHNSFNLLFGSNVRWDGAGSAPVFITGANRATIISFYFRNNVYYASLVGTGFSTV